VLSGHCLTSVSAGICAGTGAQKAIAAASELGPILLAGLRARWSDEPGGDQDGEADESESDHFVGSFG
jgi:hypothetical protein